MKNFLFNMGYYNAEIRKILGGNLISNMFSVIGTGLILFLLGLVLTGFDISTNLVEMLRSEAEISAFYDQTLDDDKTKALIDSLKIINGVHGAKLVSREEALANMEKNLGEEAKVLELFQDNIFESYIEVSIELEMMSEVMILLSETEGITHVRDNRDVLIRVQKIIAMIGILGLLIILAVGITTLVIVSHLIRQGIYINREQINTLKLLGAPGSFISFPFLMAGIILTLFGGIIGAAMIIGLVFVGYSYFTGSLPFIPLPERNSLMIALAIVIPGISIVLGIIGSIFGLSSIKEKRSGAAQITIQVE